MSSGFDVRRGDRSVLACRAAVAVSGALFLLAAWHRVPNTDEGYFANASYNLARHGFLGTTNLEPSRLGLLRIERLTYWVMPLQLVLEAAWFRLVAPTAFLARLLYLPLVPAAAYCQFRVVRGVTADPAVALLASALLPLDYYFLYAGTAARPDLLCLTLGLSGLAAYLALRERSLSLASCVAAAAIGTSLLAHPNGLLHALGLGVIAASLDGRRLGARRLVAAALALLTPLLPWVAYAALDPEAFLAQVRGNGGGRFATTLNPALLVWRELVDRYAIAYGWSSGDWVVRAKSLALGSYWLALAWLVLARSRTRAEVRILLRLALGYVLAQCVFNQKLAIYLIHVAPWYTAALAAAAVELWRARPAARALVAAAVAAIVVLQAGGFAVMTLTRSAPAAQARVVAAVERAAPQARLVFASASFAFATGFDPRYVDDAELGARSGRRPDVIVVDSFWRAHWDEWRRARRPALARVHERLAGYAKAYDRDGYQVYLRPDP